MKINENIKTKIKIFNTIRYVPVMLQILIGNKHNTDSWERFAI